MAFAQSEGIFQKMAIFWLKKCFFLQRAVTLAKIGKNANFFFCWKKQVLNFQNPSDLPKSAQNSRIGIYLKLGQILKKNVKNSVLGAEGVILAKKTKSGQICPNFK